MHLRNKFECTICLSDEEGNSRPAFPMYGALQEHIKTDHPPTCDLCGLACTSKSSLKSHIEVKHINTAVEERKKFTCPEAGCGRGFTKKGNINAHIQSAHNNKRYVCSGVDLADLNNVEGWDSSSACGEDFTTKANLQKHIRTVHMGSEGKDKYKKQKRVPMAKRAPSAAARITEANDDLVVCTILGCNERFSTTYNLVSHVQGRHGLADVEIQAMILAGHDKDAVFARSGFQGATAFATKDDLDAEAAFDMLANASQDPNMEIGDNEDASNGESFWLSGASNE